MKFSEHRLLHLWACGLRHIALQAVVNPQRVFELADTLEPMSEDLEHEDAARRIEERLEQYLKRYPEGAEDLRRAFRGL